MGIENISITFVESFRASQKGMTGCALFKTDEFPVLLLKKSWNGSLFIVPIHGLEAIEEFFCTNPCPEIVQVLTDD